MTQKAIIVDYQLGNLHSVSRACAHVGIETEISSDPDVVKDAAGLILPGVGAFGDAMGNLRDLGLDKAIWRFVEAGRPFLGICLGLQLLFDRSEEFGAHEGLGIVRGVVKRLPAVCGTSTKVKIPHVGWNSIECPLRKNWDESPLQRIAPHEKMYFVHSYYAEPDNPCETLSYTTYGGLSFCSSVQKGAVFAVQFHPEKSGERGLAIYQEWAELIAGGNN